MYGLDSRFILYVGSSCHRALEFLGVYKCLFFVHLSSSQYSNMSDHDYSLQFKLLALQNAHTQLEHPRKIDLVSSMNLYKEILEILLCPVLGTAQEKRAVITIFHVCLPTPSFLQ